MLKFPSTSRLPSVNLAFPLTWVFPESAIENHLLLIAPAMGVILSEDFSTFKSFSIVVFPLKEKSAPPTFVTCSFPSVSLYLILYLKFPTLKI